MSIASGAGGAPLPAICLMGPTAAGKSDVALELAARLPCEIVSVDSAQVYRGMDIGTAKVSEARRRGVPHHLIDIRDPDQPYSVADFCGDARRVAAEISARGRMPLFVGGTMLYFKGLIEGIAEMPSADADVRREISDLAAREGWQAVHRELREVDPEAAARIHVNDPQRIQRALEIYRVTGETMSELTRRPLEHAALPNRLVQIALVPSARSLLNERIEERFQAMVRNGLVEEVEELRRRYDLHADLPSMKAVGYRQVWRYLEQELTFAAMIEEGARASRSLAKRQMTWLRGWKGLFSVNCDADNAVAEVLKIAANENIVGGPSGAATL